MAAPAQDWFAQNAPKAKPSSGDWFADNAPSGEAELAASTAASSIRSERSHRVQPVWTPGRAWSSLNTPLPRPPGGGEEAMLAEGAPPAARALASMGVGGATAGLAKGLPLLARVSAAAFGGGAGDVAGDIVTGEKPSFENAAQSAIGTGLTELGAAAVTKGASTLMNRRVRVGTELTKKGLGIPAPPEAAELAGKQAPDAVNLARDFELAKKDLATIERNTPVAAKGSAGTFTRAKNMIDYANQLWDEGHAAPVSRNINRPTNPATLVDAGNKVLTPGVADADPAGARRARTWIANQVNKPRSLGAVDEFLRELNNDIQAPAAKEAYGNTFLRVKSAVAQAARQEIENTLVTAGETGVRDVNMRYTAIRNMADEAIKQGIAESKTEAKAGPIPDWVRPYIFAHHGGASFGLSVHPGAMLATKPSSQIAKGMGKLARTSLQPPPISAGAPPEWMSATGGPTTTEFTGGAEGPSNLGTRGQGGTRVAGLLPAPPSTTPPAVEPRFAAEGTGTVQNPSAIGARGQSGVRVRGLLPAPPPFPPTQPQVGSLPPVGFAPAPPVATTPGWEPVPKSATVAENLWNPSPTKARPGGTGGMVPVAPPKGIVAQEFKRLGLPDLISPRQQTTLETMMRGPRWRDMDALEKHDAIRTILNGGRTRQ